MCFYVVEYSTSNIIITDRNPRLQRHLSLIRGVKLDKSYNGSVHLICCGTPCLRVKLYKIVQKDIFQ